MATFLFFALSLAGCGSSADAPKIHDILFEPAGPVTTNTDVHVSAIVEGSDLEYHWTVNGGMIRNAEFHSPQQADALPEIAVTPAGHDDAGQVLDYLDFKYDNIDPVLLGHSGILANYDAIFINSSDAISVAGSDIALLSWVDSGGALYASGTAADYLIKLPQNKVTFPEPDPYVGYANTSGDEIDGAIADEIAEMALDFSNIDIAFPNYPWAPIIDTTGSVTTIATADASEIVDIDSIANLPTGEDFSEMPVTVTFSHGDGLILFTNFHCHADMNTREQNLLKYIYGLVLSHSLKDTAYTLMDMAGYFPNIDYAGILAEDDEVKYTADFIDIDDLYIVFNAPDGVFKLEIEGPNDLKKEVTAHAPISMAFPDASNGTWEFSITATDTGSDDNIPYILSTGLRTSDYQLITTVPEIIWRTPFEPDIYAVTLRVIDNHFKVAELTVGLKVK